MRFFAFLLCLTLLPAVVTADEDTGGITPERIAAAKKFQTDSVDRARLWRATVQKKPVSLVDKGVPVMNSPCSFHKRAEKPFPDDYRFKNPVFSSKMTQTDIGFFPRGSKNLRLTPNAIYFSDTDPEANDKTIFGVNFDNCRLVEDATINITYVCGSDDKPYFLRFHATKINRLTGMPRGTCLIQMQSSPYFETLSKKKMKAYFFVETNKCGKTEDFDIAAYFSSDQCIAEDQVRPWYYTDDGTCPPPQKMPTDRLINPLIKKYMTLENINSWANFKRNIHGEEPYGTCRLIGQTPSSATFRCEGVFLDLRKPNDKTKTFGFLRLRSTGFQDNYGDFQTYGCNILVSRAIADSMDTPAADVFAKLEKRYPSLYETEERLCGPTEQIAHSFDWDGIIFYADACQAPTEQGALTADDPSAFTFPPPYATVKEMCRADDEPDTPTRP